MTDYVATPAASRSPPQLPLLRLRSASSESWLMVQ